MQKNLLASKIGLLLAICYASSANAAFVEFSSAKVDGQPELIGYSGAKAVLPPVRKTPGIPISLNEAVKQIVPSGFEIKRDSKIDPHSLVYFYKTQLGSNWVVALADFCSDNALKCSIEKHVVYVSSAAGRINNPRILQIGEPGPVVSAKKSGTITLSSKTAGDQSLLLPKGWSLVMGDRINPSYPVSIKKGDSWIKSLELLANKESVFVKIDWNKRLVSLSNEPFKLEGDQVASTKSTDPEAQGEASIGQKTLWETPATIVSSVQSTLPRAPAVEPPTPLAVAETISPTPVAPVAAQAPELAQMPADASIPVAAIPQPSGANSQQDVSLPKPSFSLFSKANPEQFSFVVSPGERLSVVVIRALQKAGWSTVQWTSTGDEILTTGFSKDFGSKEDLFKYTVQALGNYGFGVETKYPDTGVIVIGARRKDL